MENDVDESGFVREGNPAMKQFFSQVCAGALCRVKWSAWYRAADLQRMRRSGPWTEPAVRSQVNEIKALVTKITTNTATMNKLYSEALEATRNADVAGTGCIARDDSARIRVASLG